MEHQQQQPQAPPLLRRRLSPPPPLHLPMCWTPTDQVIMEDLLLSHDAPTPLDAAAALTTSAVAGVARRAPQWGKRSRSVSSTSSSGSMSGSSPLSATAPAAATSASTPTSSIAKARHPTRRAPPFKVSDEERRARHRAVQKRFVQRKKEAIKQTKQLAADLERRYAVLQITSEQKGLERENAELQAQCDVAISTDGAAAARDPLVLMHEQMELVREFYVPLSHDEWTSMLRKNLDEFELARRDRSYLSSGLTIMGWHDQRKIDDSTVKFVLSKEFPNVSAHELLEKTWRQLSSPETHAQFFSPVFTVRVQVLQVINENARVIHRALYNPQTGLFAHGLDLLCRVQHGRDFIIFESAVEHNAVHACLGASHKWSKITVSQVFSPLPSGGNYGCIFRHGGLLRDFVVSSVKYWLMEMFFIALRYESAMVAPIFSLAPE